MIHPRVIFVRAAYIAAIRGVSVESVYDLVDGAGNFRPEPKAKSPEPDSYTWVFNVSAGRMRELRFWSREVDHPDATRGLSLDRVIHYIVPRRDQVPGQYAGLRNWEVGDLLSLSRKQLIQLRGELHAHNREGTIWMPRAALEDFLRRRWIFSGSRSSLFTHHSSLSL